MRRVIQVAFTAATAGIVLAVIISIAVPVATLVAGALSVAALVLGLFLVSGRQRILAVILSGVGVAALLAAIALGGSPSIDELLALNQDLTGMIVAIAFIGLVAVTAKSPEPRLSGAAAVVRTLGVTHLLGSVINMSAVAVVGDHLAREGRLSRGNLMLLTRGYTTGAFWSPFWAGFALAAVTAPGATVPVLILTGVVLAVLVLAATSPGIVRAMGDELPGYRGYALDWALLRVPLALVAVVVAAHLVAPDTPVPRIVALGAIVVTAIALTVENRRAVLGRLGGQVRHGIPAARGEVTLFVSAGVLAVGVGALLKTLSIELPIPAFTVLVAWLFVVATILLSVAGIHQLITIAVAAVVLAPLHPQPTLFAMAIMIAWGTSVTVGPISGLQMFLSARYSSSSYAVARSNIPHVIIALVLAWPALLVAQALGR